MDSACELTKLGLDRVRSGGKRIERPPALTTEMVEQCRRMADESAALRNQGLLIVEMAVGSIG